MQSPLLLTAGISGALAVALGAMGAHALALLGVGIYAVHRPSVWLKWSGRLFVIGTV